ncbi:hypothetical protein E2562_014248 [Oryza meyeriana var. granulata]|uniref:rRNA N-glycosylase n=1 Tax=Oryza meyeriana var. granulata TaxID=110450 RepID=A0A6G1BL37_9ORYZ|nr:hypothetical protein E2562_014248 [Oryza meyeriana var. granulata]
MACAGKNLFHDVPITSQVPQCQRINLLHHGKLTVSLLIDETNGYLLGFRRGDGTCLHFDDQTLSMGGTPMKLYTGLISDDEKKYLKSSLINSYHVLLNYDEKINLGNQKMRQQKKVLTQIIIMFCEASRFRPVLDFICEAMATGKTIPLDINI